MAFHDEKPMAISKRPKDDLSDDDGDNKAAKAADDEKHDSLKLVALGDDDGDNEAAKAADDEIYDALKPKLMALREEFKMEEKEFVPLAKKLLACSSGEAAELFKQIDISGKGSISLAEFEGWLSSTGGADPESNPKAQKGQKGMVKAKGNGKGWMNRQQLEEGTQIYKIWEGVTKEFNCTKHGWFGGHCRFESGKCKNHPGGHLVRRFNIKTTKGRELKETFNEDAKKISWSSDTSSWHLMDATMYDAGAYRSGDAANPIYIWLHN